MPKDAEVLISSKLAEVINLLNHPLIQSDNNKHSYKNIINFINMELRLLQAGLTDDNETNKQILLNWCANANSGERLANLRAVLDGLLPVTAPLDPASRNAKKGRWDYLREPLLTQNARVDDAIKEYLTNTRYSQKHIKLFGLDALDTICPDGIQGSRHLKLIKEGGYHAVYVVSELATPVGQLIKKGMNAGASSAAQVATNASTGFSSVAASVPIVGASITVAVATYELIKSVLKKRGYSDTAQRAVVVGMGAAAVALTILFPPYALGTSACMVGAGIYTSYIKPYFELRGQEKTLIAALDTLSMREQLISTKGLGLECNTGEKNTLVRQLTMYFAKHDALSLESMSTARELIQSGDLAAISNNLVIKEALGNKTVREVLLAHCKEEQNHVNKELAGVREQKARMAAQSINGLFTVLGACMIAVPIPPVQIAGAVILLTSSLVSLGVKYKDTIKGFFNSVKDKVIPVFNKSADTKTNDNPSPSEQLKAGEVPLREFNSQKPIPPQVAPSPETLFPKKTAQVDYRQAPKAESQHHHEKRSRCKVLSEEAVAASRALKSTLPRPAGDSESTPHLENKPPL